MAIRLRNTASRLRTEPGRIRLARLATLYEQLSLYFLEEGRAISVDSSRRRPADGSAQAELIDPTSH
jgi:hypothetical protein